MLYPESRNRMLVSNCNVNLSLHESVSTSEDGLVLQSSEVVCAARRADNTTRLPLDAIPFSYYRRWFLEH